MDNAIIKKHGVQSLAWMGTGAVLISLRGMGLIPSLLVGALIAYIGFLIKNKNKKSKYPWYLIGTGAVTMVSAIPFLGKVSNILLTVSGIILILWGLFEGLRFIFKRRKEV